MAKGKKGAATKHENAERIMRALGDLLRQYPSERTWKEAANG